MSLRDQFNLPEGLAVIEWPRDMSPESYKLFAEWLDVVKRKVRRGAIRTEPTVVELAETAPPAAVGGESDG